MIVLHISSLWRHQHLDCRNVVSTRLPHLHYSNTTASASGPITQDWGSAIESWQCSGSHWIRQEGASLCPAITYHRQSDCP